ncbi:hypothetical protein [Parvibaculum sedimenti]|uniref:hypothetical protein n=1 Tax=Parvibaculum sedimenti TaxID=2608632 RepID=UPI00163ABACD|nr:hypothetical protein [Parvibaculum sedimenti]
MSARFHNSDNVRGGVTGHGVRYVLAFSLFAAWAILSLLVISSATDLASTLNVITG